MVQAIKLGKDKEDNNFYKDRTSRRSIMDIWSHTNLIKQDPAAMKKFNGENGERNGGILEIWDSNSSDSLY